LNALEASDMSIAYTDEDFLFEQCFAVIRFLRGCPTMPDPSSHLHFSPYEKDYDI